MIANDLKASAIFVASRLGIISLAGVAIQYLLIAHLTKEDFGFVVWVNTILSLLAIFGLPGVSNSIPGAVAKGFVGNFIKGTFQEIKGSVLGGLALVGIATWYWSNPAHDDAHWILLMLALLSPGLWLDTWQGYWMGQGNFKAIAFLAVPVKLIQLALVAIAMLFKPVALLAVLSIQGVQAIANLTCSLALVRKNIEAKDLVSTDFVKYGWASTRLYLYGIVISQFDKLLVGGMFGVSELAVYAVAELIYQYMYTVPKVLLEQLFIPRLAKLAVKESARQVAMVQKWVAILLLPALLVIGLSIHFIQPSLIVNKYAEAETLIYLFLVSVAASIPLFLVGAMLKSHGMIPESNRVQLLSSGVLLTLSLPVALLFGIAGLVVVRIIQYTLVSTYCIIVIRRYRLN